MPSIANTKSELRQQLRAARRAVSAQLRDEAKGLLAHHFAQLPNWEELQRLALYLAADGEIDPTAVAREALAAGKAIYLPVIQQDKSLLFARWDGDTAQLTPNEFGIGEPPADSPRLAAVELDCICLPLVAWDADGSRLGMGGGYYDRTLAAGTTALKVGLGFELQRQEALPREKWDVKLDYVATEASLYTCASEAQ